MKASGRINKWPFVIADVVLLGLAGVLLAKAPSPIGAWQGAICLVAVGLGAYLSTVPFLRDYDAAADLAEAQQLAGVVAKLRNLEHLQQQIAAAPEQWRESQATINQSLTANRELSERIRNDLAEFCAALGKANDAEKSNLRLEVEKQRRAEGEWLQVVVYILDHVHALHAAGIRSGQPKLIAQLDHFQFACRDAARRLGLVPLAPARGEPFQGDVHQVADGLPTPPPGSLITETLVLGFKFQGQLVRRAVVKAGDAGLESAEAKVTPDDQKGVETDSNLERDRSRQERLPLG